MTIKVGTYFWGEKRRRGEGLRLGCTRYLPRGIKKEDYATQGFFDVWLPTLAPSRELLGRILGKQEQPGAWERFVKSYRDEMKQTDQRQLIRTLALLATRTPISLGCSCHGERCHRFELERLIRAAADGET